MCLGRLAGRAAHELKNPLNGLALNVEVVRTRSARAGTQASSIAPYASAAALELERVIPLVEALLVLARPVSVPVDLRVAVQPLITLYAAIAVAGGGSLNMGYEAEQMFVAAEGDCVRALLAEALDVSIGANLEVSGLLGTSDGRPQLRLVGGAGRPVSARIERLAVERGVQLSSDEDETLLQFPSLARAGVDSNT